MIIPDMQEDDPEVKVDKGLKTFTIQGQDITPMDKLIRDSQVGQD